MSTSESISTEKHVLLFLCTGNYYRSRYAEILFNQLASQRGLNWIADSRGLRLESLNPGPISRFTIDRLQELGILLEEPIRYPMPLTEADLKSARHVVAVKEIEHRPLMQQQFCDWADRVEFWAVDDVDCAVPEIALPLLHRHVIALIERLSSSGEVGQPIAR